MTSAADAERLIADLEARLRPLEVALAEAWWETNTRSSPEAASRREAIELQRRAVLSEADTFAAIQSARAEVDGRDPLVARQLDVLHDTFVPHQVPEDLRRRMVELEVSIEGAFNSFRGEIAGRRVDDNEILSVLRTSDDARERQAAWEASKQVGAQVAENVRELARVRNEAARSLGFRDHFDLALTTSELDEDRLFATLDAVDRATADPFAGWKTALDSTLGKRFGCAPDDLRPWHYDDPFFQDPPGSGVRIDDVFAHTDLEALTVRTYDGIGLDLRPVLAHSDLYAREGKSQHAFCIHIDRSGDVRVLCNVQPNARWAETMLHEFGHAAYDRALGHELPWFLREPAHALTTEGVAMLFGRLARRPEWLESVVGVPGQQVDSLSPDLQESRRAALLVFARWVLVMTNFERGLYADPDADHDGRWWDLVDRFQQVHRPDARNAPDWAAKIHLAVAPVYYQNYLYGELVASQLQATLSARAGGIIGRPEAGRFLAEEFFGPGAALRWDRLVETATGEALTVDHFARELTPGGTGD